MRIRAAEQSEDLTQVPKAKMHVDLVYRNAILRCEESLLHNKFNWYLAWTVYKIGGCCLKYFAACLSVNLQN